MVQSWSRAAVCGLVVGLAASNSNAEISITFDDPTSGSEFFHSAPAQPGDPGIVSFRDDFPVDLELVGTNEAAFLGVLNFTAMLVTNFEVGAITSTVGAPITEASISGSFSWVDVDTNQTILSGEFTEAAIIQFGLAGSIITTSEIVGGQLAYTPGQSLIDLGVNELFDPQDGVWSLTDVEFDNDQSIIELGSDRYFNTFEANTSFTGTVFVPAPGTALLAGCMCLISHRRRRSL